MRNRIWIGARRVALVTVVVVLMGSSIGRAPASSSSSSAGVDDVRAAAGSQLVRYSPDPVYGGVGFVRTHWATSINKMLVFLVPGKDTSVRAFDPVTNGWEFLWPSNTLGIEGRDNFASFYVPRLDELWVWNGSYLWNDPQAKLSSRFHVSQKRWLASGTTDSAAFTGMVDMSATGIMPFSGTDPAMAWAAQRDMGIMFGGSSGTQDAMFIFEPKPGGPEPYRVTQFTGHVLRTGRSA